MRRFVAASRVHWPEKPIHHGVRPTIVKTYLLGALVVLASACSGGAASTTTDPTGVVVGTVVAGPTCPVEQEPPDPGCADLPVDGAVIVVMDAGQELTRVTTGEDGTFEIRLPIGTEYRLVPQAVEGLLGTPEAAAITLTAVNERILVTFAYDTGIR